MKTIFTHENYRIYLRDWLINQPKKGRGVLKVWSERLRIEPSVLSQILSGKRELTIDQAHELKIYLGLNDLETEYFSTMVLMERATTRKLKMHLKEKLKKIRLESLTLAKRLEHEDKLTEEQKAIFYSSWLYSAVTMATSLPQYQTTEAISEKFKIDLERIREILAFLRQAGLLVEELGKYRSSSKRTHLEKSSPLVIKHHANWRVKALQRAEDLKEDELMFTGPLTISRSDFLKVREEIVALVKRVSETVKETTPEDLAVFQVDLFWMK